MATPVALDLSAQSTDAQPKDSDGATAMDGVMDLGRFPARLLAVHMMEIFEYEHSRFYQLVRLGRFDQFEIRPRIGRRAWSKALVQRNFDGERFFSAPRALRRA